jgi:acyl-CoA reductase-like NAD-dependent aldehyde dehydrogenase
LNGTEFETKLMTLNPATEEILKEYEIMTKEKIHECVKKAREAFSEWKKDIHRRSMLLQTNLERIRKFWLRLPHKKWEKLSKNQGLK